MKSNNVQEVCEDQLSEMSSQAASNNEASNTSSGPKLALDLSLTVTAAATTTKWSTTDSNGGAQAAREPTRVFTCNYCHRKFFSSQALGRYQNAHRRERTLARRALHQLEAYPYGYADVASLSLYGSPGLYLNRIQAHAWVHPAAAQAERQQQEDVAVLAAPACARALLGPMPFLVGGDEEVSFRCPGSVRPPRPGAGVLPLFHSGHNLGQQRQHCGASRRGA